MISDGHNLMLDTREEYRLYLILKSLDDEYEKFDPSNESDMILRKWIQDYLATMEQCRHNPFETKTI